MTNYLIRRSITMFIVIVLSTVVIFYILMAMPGGPITLVRGQNTGGRVPTREEILQLQRLFGLDKPAHLRYVIWLAGDDWIEALPVWFTGLNNLDEPFTNGNQRGILRGDWGDSQVVARGKDVKAILQGRAGNTVLLIGLATLLSLIVAIPIGILSAARQYSTLDYAATAFSFVGISMPIFWLGLMMIIFFSLKFKEWGLPSLPSGGIMSYRGEGAGSLSDRVQHLIMPTIVLALAFMAGWSRFMRTSMLDVLKQDYVRAARAKGLTERVVIIKHALRNALVPLITIVALQLPGLFGGAVLTETIFAYPGMGRLYFQAISAGDWPLIMGYLLILAVLVVLSNLLADMAYVLVDPRIRYD